MKINDFPQLTEVGDDDLLLIWDAQTDTTKTVKASTLKALFGSSTAAPVIPIRIEAENYSAMSGIQTESCAEGGQNVGFIEPGDWMDYSVSIPITGNYQFTLRVASPNSNTQIQIRLGSRILTTVTLPNTRGYQAWQSTQSSLIALSSGTQTLRIHSLSAGWNINWFEFVKV